MKNLLGELLAQLGVTVVVAAIAGVLALMTTVPIGGAALGVAPDFHFRLLGGVACGQGETVELEEGGYVTTYSDGTPSTGREIILYCVDEAGNRRLLDGQSSFVAFMTVVGAALGAYWLVCFAPVFLVAAPVSWWLTHKGLAALRRRGQPREPTLI